ncbi:MAG: autotransporter assembly complex family protein, partial [Pseudomonadales bacterium]
MRLPVLFILACLLGHGVFAGVRVSGVSDLLETNVLAHLKLDDEACEQEPARIRYRYEAAPAEILAALKPYGYYHAKVDASLEQPPDRCWEAEFTVTPGEPVVIGEVRIEVLGEGVDLAEFQSLVAGTDIRSGRQLNHGAYERLKTKLLVTARELGFFDAALIAKEIRVQRNRYLADVSLVLDSGSRFRFGELHVEGDVLEKALLMRYVEFEPGAPFEQRRIRELHNDLIRGDFFSTVDVRTEIRPDKTVDVFLDLKEGRRIRYGVGVGFGTDTGLIVSGDVVNRRLNRRGHRLELDSELSRVRQNITFDYRIPGVRPQRDWYSFYGGLGRKN